MPRRSALLLRLHGIASDPEQIRHRFGGGAFGSPRCCAAPRSSGSRRGSSPRGGRGFKRTPLPAIAERRDGGFLLLARASATDVAGPGSRARPAAADERAPSSRRCWSGRLVLMTRRAALADLARRFDITWFLQAMHKYRRLLGEVLVASFFLQLFALVTPLFFQVVIDKVLVHRGLTTLDVLVIGLITVSIFETLLGALRTYVFAHTTNRIDVELGARLFRHLLALPIAYFEARRAGDSVARVRELENIRNFLTSSALTLVHRPVLHLRVPGGDVLLLAAADLDRARLASRSTSLSRPA